MSFEGAFSAHEERERQAVYASTWGHLAPKKNVKYHGTLLFCFCLYDNSWCVLNREFISRTGEELSDSPWYYDCQQDFMQAVQEDAQDTGGIIFKFDGFFRNYRFIGEITKIPLHETLKEIARPIVRTPNGNPIRL